VPSSSDLTTPQLDALSATLSRQALYLRRLVARMDRLRWPQDDPTYARALRARDGVMALLAGLDDLRREKQKPAWLRARGL
jgi:hypothetical protein